MTDEAKDTANVALMLDEAVDERIIDTVLKLVTGGGPSAQSFLELLHARLTEYEQERGTLATGTYSCGVEKVKGTGSAMKDHGTVTLTNGDTVTFSGAGKLTLE